MRWTIPPPTKSNRLKHTEHVGWEVGVIALNNLIVNEEGKEVETRLLGAGRWTANLLRAGPETFPK